jgi:DNA-binding phage protein
MRYGRAIKKFKKKRHKMNEHKYVIANDAKLSAHKIGIVKHLIDYEAEFEQALRYVAKYMGANKKSLYKIFDSAIKIQFNTIFKLIKSFGFAMKASGSQKKSKVIDL